jgi:hypothetical protein
MLIKCQKDHHEDAPPPITIPLQPLYKEEKRQGREQAWTSLHKLKHKCNQATHIMSFTIHPPKYCSSKVIMYSK